MLPNSLIRIAAGIVTCAMWLTPAVAVLCTATTVRGQCQPAVFSSFATASGGATSIAVSGDYAILGDSGNTYAEIFKRNSAGLWISMAQLTPPDGAFNNNFGAAVATDGTTAVVGAPFDNQSAFGAGAAYVWKRFGNSWVYQTKLRPLDAPGLDWYGSAVAVSGSRLLIGSPLDDDVFGSSGSVYMYVQNNGAWPLVTKLHADTLHDSDRFGYSISISGDRALISADGDDQNGDLSGAAFVFDLTNAGGTQSSKLLLDSTSLTGLPPLPVSMSGDTAVVGKNGKAFLFRYANGSWSSDGTITGVGASSVATNGARVITGPSGSTFRAYERINGTWTLVATLNQVGGANRCFADGERVFLANPAAGFEMIVCSSLVIRDPNFIGTALIANGQITNDVNALGSGGVSRLGLTADGTTRLVLMRLTNAVGMVEFRVRNENDVAANVGSLSTLGGNENATTLQTQSVQLNDGRFAAFVILSAPSDFVRSPADNTLRTRPIVLNAIYNGADSIRALDLRRPPVVLIHGVWSDGTVFKWDGVINDTLRRWDVVRGDYKSSNSFLFASNIHKPRQFIAIAMKRMRDQGIACTKADVFGHSMGGLLTRLWIGGYPPFITYLRNDNYMSGDVHKLVTVNTPHFGSPLGDLLVASSGDLTWTGEFLKSIGATQWLGCMDCGAVLGLRTSNPLYAALPAAAVPAHGMVGVGGSDIIEEALLSLIPGSQPNVGTLIRTLKRLGLIGSLFPPGLQHDMIVGRLSQEAGLSGGYLTQFGLVIIPPKLAIHTSAPYEQRNNDRAIELLNTPVTDAAVFSANFPAHNGSEVPFSPPPRPPQPIITKDLLITSPADGAPVTAGQQITVSVSTLNGFTPTSEGLILIAGNQVTEDSSAPYSAMMTIPIDALGPLKVSAMAVNAAGNAAYATPITVNVSTTATLAGLRFDPDQVMLFNFAPHLQPRLIGQYSDAVERNLTGVAGAVYNSAGPGIATVNSVGEVQSVAVGLTSITAAYSGKTAYAEVQVISLPRLGDTNFDGYVNVDDLLTVINAWGPCANTSPGGCPADIAPPPNGNGFVNVDDLLLVINNWG